MYKIQVRDNGYERVTLVPNYQQVRDVVGDRLKKELAKEISLDLQVHTIRDIVKHYSIMLEALLKIEEGIPNGIVLQTYNGHLSYTVEKINSFTIKYGYGNE